MQKEPTTFVIEKEQPQVLVRYQQQKRLAEFVIYQEGQDLWLGRPFHIRDPERDKISDFVGNL